MRSLNRVTLLGNLGRDAETKFTPAGHAVTKFSIATTRRIKDGNGEWKDETDWHNVVLWRNEKLAEFLKKGKQVYVEGRLSTRSYEKDGAKVYATDVVAEDVILLGGQGGDGVASQPRGKKQEQPQQQGEWTGGSDDDVPF